MYFFVIARPWRAVINEACCLVATILLAAILIIGPDSTSVEKLIAVLGAGTGIGAVIGVAQTRIVPAVLGGGWKWLRDHWRTGVQLAESRRQPHSRSDLTHADRDHCGHHGAGPVLGV